MSRLSLDSNSPTRDNVETERLIENLTETYIANDPVDAPLVATSTSNGGLERPRWRENAPNSGSRAAQLRPLSISPPPSQHGNGIEDAPPRKLARNEAVTWSSLPRKGQLAILTLARLAEPLAQTSLSSYLYYQLKSFDPSQPPSQITSQAGVVIAAFAAAQAVTAVFWGSVADSLWGGRKFVIIIGLLGTSLGSLGYGFSGSWQTAAAWRMVSGTLNGNVGVMRTMISEIVKEKKYQSRAFLLLPMCFNIGIIIGPLLGGLLADPIGSYPGVFGPDSLIGGKDGVWWMKRWPYSLPNIVSSTYLFAAALLVWLGMEETHEVLRERPDIGLRLGRQLRRLFGRLCGRRSHDYSPLSGYDADTVTDLESHTAPTTPATPLTPVGRRSTRPTKRKLPFRRLWTRNVIWTLVSHFILTISVGTFHALWVLFLSTPRWDPTHPSPPTLTDPRPPVHFSGGLGLPPARIGAASAGLGVMGITLQLVLYPRVATRLGTLRALQVFAPLFPLVYLATPYLALVPSSGAAPPAPVEGVAVWAAIAAVLGVQVCARTFALPSTAILINNASPHPSVLGTVHGIAQSVSGIGRTVGPIGAGWVFGRGLRLGVVGLAFWIMAACALAEVAVSYMLVEGDGHEIWLEGEKEEAAQEQEQEQEQEERARAREHERNNRPGQ